MKNYFKTIFFTTVILLQSLLGSTQTTAIPSFGTDKTLDIATWNVQLFPKNGQSTIDSLSAIIQALSLDLIAFQEINDTNSFKQLASNLPNYTPIFASERYRGLAYLYNSEVIEVNNIYEIYTESMYWNPLPRSPLVLDITYNGERIVFINNHFKCCGDDILDTSNIWDEEYRRLRASNLLKSYIDSNLKETNVIILGDLNDDIAEPEPNNVFISFLNDSLNYLFADMDIAKGPSTAWSYPSWPSHIDHILLTKKLISVFRSPESHIETLKLETYFNDSWQAYHALISDHRPVALRLNLAQNNSAINLPKTNNISMYPNPASHAIHIVFEQISVNQIQLCNASGKVIYSAQIASNNHEHALPLTNYPSGTYWIRLKNNKDTLYTKKIIVQ